jgi:CheY-like chemotaxis protein
LANICVSLVESPSKISGKGTSFHLTIPYKIARQELIQQPKGTPVLTNRNHFEGSCILVAEDNQINQSLLKHLFENWNLQFDMVTNGKEAIEQLQLNPNKYSLVLMDIQMPGMDGYTCTRQIRETLQSGIPIIAMTAHAFAGEREKCVAFGMNDYISKPIREETLHQLITRFTNVPDTEAGKADSSSIIADNGYQFIDLTYMKEVSAGNIEYEKTVTEQFMEAVPEDVAALQKAWQQNDTATLRQVAHNMKTTVSVMGLNELLQPQLDALEYEDLTEDKFKQQLQALSSVLSAAVEEAKLFYASL